MSTLSHSFMYAHIRAHAYTFTARYKYFYSLTRPKPILFAHILFPTLLAEFFFLSLLKIQFSATEWHSNSIFKCGKRTSVNLPNWFLKALWKTNYTIKWIQHLFINIPFVPSNWASEWVSEWGGKYQGEYGTLVMLNVKKEQNKERKRPRISVL